MTAPRLIEFHPEAIAEAEAAATWYRLRSERAAAAFLAELDNAIEQISITPGRFPAYLRDARRILLHRFPFAVVFREVDETVQVISVAHGRRKPGYWISR